MSDSEQCSNRLELDLISLLVKVSCELGQIMTRYDFLWARWFWAMFEPTWTLTNSTFGQLFMWIVGNNDQIITTSYGLGERFRGHKGQLAPRCRALDAMIKKFYSRIQKAVHPFRFQNFEHIVLGSGWNHNLRSGCRRHLVRIFYIFVRLLRLDAPALFPESAVPITAKVGIKFLCPYSGCFGSYFDVIFLMYLDFLAFLLSQPHHHPHRPSLAKSECAERWS